MGSVHERLKILELKNYRDAAEIGRLNRQILASYQQFIKLSNGFTFGDPMTFVNHAPNLASFSNITNICNDGGSHNVTLGGIDDGDGGIGQVITITATSSNTGLIPNPSITYTSPNATGTLTYSTDGSGTSGSATISVKAMDDGGTAHGGADTTVRTFTITTVTTVGPPTLDPITTSLHFAINDPNSQTVNVSGIGFGLNPGGAATTLFCFCVSSNTSVVPTPSTTYVSPAATTSFVIGPPLPGASGTLTMTVHVTTNGPTGACKSNSITHAFTVTVS